MFAMAQEGPTSVEAEILEQCQEAIGYRFRQPDLLRSALTHASGANTRLASNERMEFLGDAVLGLVTCEQLYLRFPAIPGAPRVALRGFQRVALKAGETRTVSFDLSPRDLSAVTADGQREVMAGGYTVSVGSGQPGTGVAIREAHFSVDSAVAMPD